MTPPTQRDRDASTEHRQYPSADRPQSTADLDAGGRMASNISSFGRDLLTLIDLQIALFKSDVSEFTAKSLIPTVLCAIGIFALLGAVPVALVGLAYALSSWMGWTLASSFAAAAGVGLILFTLFAGLGVLLIVNNLKYLKRSQYELGRNMAWLKQSLGSR